jgi:hypothetical protein
MAHWGRGARAVVGREAGGVRWGAMMGESSSLSRALSAFRVLPIDGNGRQVDAARKRWYGWDRVVCCGRGYRRGEQREKKSKGGGGTTVHRRRPAVRRRPGEMWPAGAAGRSAHTTKRNQSVFPYASPRPLSLSSPSCLCVFGRALLLPLLSRTRRLPIHRPTPTAIKGCVANGARGPAGGAGLGRRYVVCFGGGLALWPCSGGARRRASPSLAGDSWEKQGSSCLALPQRSRGSSVPSGHARRVPTNARRYTGSACNDTHTPLRSFAPLPQHHPHSPQNTRQQQQRARSPPPPTSMRQRSSHQRHHPYSSNPSPPLMPWTRATPSRPP